MDMDIMGNIDISQHKFIEALSREEAVEILLALCKDSNIAKRIASMAKASLAEVDAEAVADAVFKSLNSIQVEDLWENSGKTYTGYHEPTEVAFEMIEDELHCYIQKMEQYRDLGMKTAEKEYCKGIITGLLQYGQDGSNDFYDWCPDDPYTIAENIIYNWKKDHSADEVEEIQAVYDSYLANDS